MTVDLHDVEEFLGLRRIAVIGVSDEPKGSPAPSTSSARPRPRRGRRPPDGDRRGR